MSQILKAWEHAYPQKFYAQLPQNLQRRSFLFSSAKAATALALAPLFLQLSACKRGETPSSDLKQHPWSTFAAVHEVLFPADGNGPSAQDIQATHYLQLVVQTKGFDADERRFILEGIDWLDQFQREQKKPPFMTLTVSQRDEVLRAIASSTAGDRWLNVIMSYVLEALLSDPVYGGNPQGIGWQWLQHQPGFPRPTQPYYQQGKI
jgi:gluconate 2-dehydrogenase gamma chain